MWSESEIINFTKTEIIPFTKKVKEVVDYIVSDKDIKAIGKEIPHGERILAALGGVDKALGLIGRNLPYVGLAFDAWNAYNRLGGAPMDPSAPEWRDYLKDYDGRTGG